MYAEAVAREIREDCDWVLWKMYVWLVMGKVLMVFDLKC